MSLAIQPLLPVFKRMFFVEIKYHYNNGAKFKLRKINCWKFKQLRIIMLIFCLKLDKKKEKKEEKVCDMPPSKPNHYLSIKNLWPYLFGNPSFVWFIWSAGVSNIELWNSNFYLFFWLVHTPFGSGCFFLQTDF